MLSENINITWLFKVLILCISDMCSWRGDLNYCYGYIHEVSASYYFIKKVSVKLIYRVGQKSKLLILSECVNKTGKIGGMWTTKHIYRENGAMSDIFTWNILSQLFYVYIFYDWKQSMKLLLGKHELAYVNMTS